MSLGRKWRWLLRLRSNWLVALNDWFPRLANLYLSRGGESETENESEQLGGESKALPQGKAEVRTCVKC